MLTSLGNPASTSWGYTPQGQSTSNSLGFSQIQESSRPSSTNPYTSASIQAFDRAGSAWQTSNLDPSDFPALGSGTNSVSHGPPSSQSYASTAGTGAMHQQRLQQQMGVYGRPSGGNDDSPFNVNAPFSQDEFPALGGMTDVHSQRQGLPQHLAGQSNGVYDPRQQGGGSIMTPPPNLQGSQSLQQAQDHRASMLEALQQGQRAPPRTGPSPSVLVGILSDRHEVTAGSSVKDNRSSLQNYLGDEQKLGSEAGGFSNTTGLSGEEINAAADAAQSLPTNSNQNDYNSQEVDNSKREDSDADVWGIKGLLGIIKIEDSDKSKLALGVDLTSLGLNMNQPEYSLFVASPDKSVRPLFPMFHSPWQDLSRQPAMPDFDPKYDLPACYRMSAPPSAQSKMTKFSDETLFYIFYAMPQDVLQDAAAYEL